MIDIPVFGKDMAEFMCGARKGLGSEVRREKYRVSRGASPENDGYSSGMFGIFD